MVAKIDSKGIEMVCLYNGCPETEGLVKFHYVGQKAYCHKDKDSKIINRNIGGGVSMIGSGAAAMAGTGLRVGGKSMQIKGTAYTPGCNKGTTAGRMKAAGNVANVVGAGFSIAGGVTMLTGEKHDPNEYCSKCKKSVESSGCTQICQNPPCNKAEYSDNMNYSNKLVDYCGYACKNHTPDQFK